MTKNKITNLIHGSGFRCTRLEELWGSHTLVTIESHNTNETYSHYFDTNVWSELNRRIRTWIRIYVTGRDRYNRRKS